MLYSEIIAVCSEIHTKHINTLCGPNVELLNVKRGGTYSNHGTTPYIVRCPEQFFLLFFVKLDRIFPTKYPISKQCSIPLITVTLIPFTYRKILLS
jgi:hypothetical protein